MIGANIADILQNSMRCTIVGCRDVPELFAYRLSLQHLHVKVVGLGWHDEEHHHCDVVLMHLGEKKKEKKLQLSCCYERDQHMCSND